VPPPTDLILFLYRHKPISQAQTQDSLLTSKESDQVMQIRALAWLARIGTRQPTPDEYHALVAEHPFDWVSSIQARRLTRNGADNELPSSAPRSPWMDEFLHKYLIFVALIRRIHKHPESRYVIGPLLGSTSIRILMDLEVLRMKNWKGLKELHTHTVDMVLELCGLSLRELQAKSKGDMEEKIVEASEYAQD